MADNDERTEDRVTNPPDGRVNTSRIKSNQSCLSRLAKIRDDIGYPVMCPGKKRSNPDGDDGEIEYEKYPHLVRIESLYPKKIKGESNGRTLICHRCQTAVPVTVGTIFENVRGELPDFLHSLARYVTQRLRYAKGKKTKEITSSEELFELLRKGNWKTEHRRTRNRRKERFRQGVLGNHNWWNGVTEPTSLHRWNDFILMIFAKKQPHEVRLAGFEEAMDLWEAYQTDTLRLKRCFDMYERQGDDSYYYRELVRKHSFRDATILDSYLDMAMSILGKTGIKQFWDTKYSEEFVFFYNRRKRDLQQLVYEIIARGCNPSVLGKLKDEQVNPLELRDD